MRIHTLAGDVIDLRFLWPLGTMHAGRQAARRYAERQEHVMKMRRDPDIYGGTEKVISDRMSPDGMERIVIYRCIPGLTPDEREIPYEELWVRDKQAPMINTAVEGMAKMMMLCDGIEPDTDAALERARAIHARIEAYILSALSNNPKVP